MIGRTIQHYKIVEALGRGGMGVVYKACDTHLDRFVAIKVLPPEKLADPERKRRFIQEAKAASALRHPNIITVHDIAEDAGMDFMVMEYVPGKTLDRLIGRKGLRIEDALKYAAQIADALASAHAAGIIHRDMKPSNLMVDEHGLVKVLDFGLAKLMEAATGELVATQTLKAETAEGAVVGTVAYMSPEQAESKRIDARSDIFSFGAVLYEMITGRRAFQRDSTISTLSAILRDQPEPAGKIASGVPAELERILTRCLRKDRGRRFQDMADVKVALQDAVEELSEGRLAAANAAPERDVLRHWIAVAALVVVLAIAAGAIWLGFGHTPAGISGAKVMPGTESALIPVPLTTYRGRQMSPSFSPDGNQVAFAWNGPKQDNFDIYVKLIGENEPLRLTKDPAGDYDPAWSPDGRWIAFLRYLSGDKHADHEDSVFLVPSIGGPERKLAEAYGADYLATRLSWHPAGKWLAITDRNSSTESRAVFLLSVETGEKRRLTSPPAKAVDGSAAVSPDGRAVVFVRTLPHGASDLYVLELAEDLSPRGEPKRLTFVNQYAENPAWMPDGRAILFESGSSHAPNLCRIRVPGAGERPDKPERLAFAGEGARMPAVSQKGHLAFFRYLVDTDIWRVEVAQGRDGPVAVKPAAKLIASTRMDHTPQYSPDGNHIAFGSNRTGSHEIWVCDGDGSNAVQLTSFGGPYTADPHWSPDGRWIMFSSRAEGHSGLYLIPSSGGRPKLLRNIFNAEPSGWSRDGKWIYFTSERAGEPQVWRVPAEGGDPAQVTRTTGSPESPDGGAVYFLKNGALWKIPAGGGQETQVLPSVINNDFAVVARGIYFIPDSKKPSIQFLNFATGKIATIAPASPGFAYGFSVSPDERWILYSQPEPADNGLMLVENFR